MAMIVRRAESSDVEWLLTQLRVFSKFFGSKRDLFPDTDFARAQIGVMIKDHVVFIACREDKTRCGFIAGHVMAHPFNPQIRVLSEQFWWVAEEHRGSRAALMLLQAFKAWGKAHVDWICMALEAHSPVSERALSRRGFKLQERSFLMEVG